MLFIRSFRFSEKYRLFCYGHSNTQLVAAIEDVAVFCQFRTASVNNVRMHVALHTSIVNVSIKIGTELSEIYAAEKTRTLRKQDKQCIYNIFL